MMIDDDTLKQLLRIDDELLNEQRDTEILSRLVRGGGEEQQRADFRFNIVFVNSEPANVSMLRHLLIPSKKI
jgi:hypothetical protein